MMIRQEQPAPVAVSPAPSAGTAGPGPGPGARAAETAAALPPGSWTRHGFPRGFRFVPRDLELISLLSARIHGHRFAPPLAGIFHDLRILNYHPDHLHEMFKEDAEHGFIYFFSRREFQNGDGAVDDARKKVSRPVRVASGGGWKPSGGGQPLFLPRKKGGFLFGRLVTMVFYERADAAGKTSWGMHEFTIPLQKDLLAITPYTRFENLALYRLYKIKHSDKEAERIAQQQQQLKNAYGHRAAAAFAGTGKPSASTAVAPAPWPAHLGGVFAANQALAGATTSQMPQTLPPPPPPQQQQLGFQQHAQYHYHQPQYAFGAAAAGAGGQQQQQLRAMPTRGAGSPGHFQFAVPQAPVPVPPAAGPNQAPPQGLAAATHGAGQEGGHFGVALPPSSTSAPVPPAAANQAPPQGLATATNGVGQDGGHFGVALPPPSPSAPVPPAAAADTAYPQPAALATAMHGAGKEHAGQFGADTSLPPSPPVSAPPTAAPASPPPPEQKHANATATAPVHARSADIVDPAATEAAPPPPEVVAPAVQDDADAGNNYTSDMDFSLLDDPFLGGVDDLFTMDEIMGGSALEPGVDDLFTLHEIMAGSPLEPLEMGGDEIGRAGGEQQEPLAAL